MRELIINMEAEIHRLKWLAAFSNFETAVRRYSLSRQNKFRVDQLRVPTGNPDGGQWTHEGGAGEDRSQDRRVRLASEQRPEIPKERPATAKERNQIARGLARGRPITAVEVIASGALWLQEFVVISTAASDPPKSLAELQHAISDPRPGYDIHHIVERATSAGDGSEDRLINSPENLV